MRIFLSLYLAIFSLSVLAIDSTEAQRNPQSVIHYFFDSLHANKLNDVKSIISPRLKIKYSGSESETTLENWAIGFRSVTILKLDDGEEIKPYQGATRTIKYHVLHDLSGHHFKDIIAVSLINGLWYWDQDHH
ncbi:MAG: hypothetical protein OEY19_03210 [Gammaproteobacteria bacterium]|nr:hypothetical protein [Gammaproteobacteria bacterium]